jgi:hypothetical protein
MNQHSSSLSRVDRRRAELALRPPHILGHLIGSVPLLALAVLLLSYSTGAWFYGRTSVVSNTLASGTFVSLMTLSTDSLSLEGLRGSDFSDRFTVRSKATVTVPIKVSWEGGAGPGSLSLSSDSIGPGEAVTVTVSGTFGSDFSGNAVVMIGSANYDWGTLVVHVDARTIPITRLTTVEVLGKDGIFKSGTAAPMFEWVPVMKVTQPEGAGQVWIKVSISQDPEPGGADEIDPVLVRPAEFKTTAGGTYIELYQDHARHDYPTYVTITLRGTADYVTGTQTQTVILTHAGDVKEVTGGTSSQDAPAMQEVAP